MKGMCLIFTPVLVRRLLGRLACQDLGLALLRLIDTPSSPTGNI